MDEPQADDERGPVPRFDPVAGMRAMADIQAEGLRAAGELLERMLGSEVDGAGQHPQPPSGQYGALVEAWTELLRQTIAVLAPPGRPGPLMVSIDTNGVGPPVRVAPQGSADVWLHNGTSSAVGPLVMRCGPLAGADGSVLEGDAVRFEPRELAALAPRSSRAVTVSLANDGSVPPGTYRGTIQADGAPGLWLPLEVSLA
jgi:hypothetical protein